MSRRLLAPLVLLVLASPAHGAGFSPVEDLAPPGSNVDYNAQAIGPGGHAAVVWQDYDATPVNVVGRFRDPGGSFSAVDTLSTSGVVAHEPAVAVDGAGTVIVVFAEGGVGADEVKAVVRPPGGTFGEPVTLSQGLEGPGRPEIAMNAAGEAVIAWVRSEGGTTLRAVTRSASGAFGEPVSLGTVTSEQVSVAIDADGDARIGARGPDQRASVATRPAGGGFGALTPVSPEGVTTINPHVYMGAAGHTALTWTTGPGATGNYAIAPPGGAFGAPDDVGTLAETTAPVVDFDASGGGLMAWAKPDGADDRIALASFPAGGAVGEPTFVSPGDQGAYGISIDIAPSGAAVVAWRRGNLTDGFLGEAIVRGPGGAFSEPLRLTPEGINADYPFAGIDDGGNVLASWYAYGPGIGQYPQWRVYDPETPALEPAVPATAVVGSPVAFSATAADRWSAVGELAWTFGDGTSASGASVSHTYDRPGTFEVGVATSDARGNAASATRTVQVGVPVAVLQKLRITPKRFRARRRGPSVASKGARVRYELSVAARVVFRVQRKKGKRFRTLRGRFGVDSQAGQNTFRFSGRLRGRKLRPGRHRLVATPRNGAGKGETVRVAFRIVR